jgi:hypothetical protein
MPEITVSLDGQDHRIIGDEKTFCGLVVPHGTEWVDTLTKPCPVCFPAAKAEPKPADEPTAKAAVKATKAG